MIQDIAPHRLNNQYDPGRCPQADDIVMAFRGQDVLCRMDGAALHFLRFKELESAEGGSDEAASRDLIYLFSIDEKGFFLLADAAGDGSGIPEGYEFHEIWRRRGELEIPQEMMFAVSTGIHLTHWYRMNRHCGRCGERTVHADDERALICPHCGNRIYPRLMPAVIVGVTNGDELLVTKYGDRPLPFYALVAGFVEIGETLEECVQREVMEEVGLRVKNIRYYKSQPWGIVDDILAGFYCDVDGDPTVHLDRTELREGIWVGRGEVPLQPDNYSLTGEMMRMFNEGKA